MSAPPELFLVSAAGNRFAVADGFRHAPPRDPSALAATLRSAAVVTSDGEPLRGPIDGLLLLDAEGEGAIRMTLYNADGGRAEACGNGLRCLAAIAVEEGYLKTSAVLVHTDAGPRSVVVERANAQELAATATMGAVRAGPSFRFDHAGTSYNVLPVQIGNPHAVVFVDDVEGAPLDALGRALERCGRFPAGTNVEVARAPASEPSSAALIPARVFERGVGETASCGTGACAVARAASERFGTCSPVRVAMPGGVLEVSWTSWDDVRLRGPVLREGTIRVEWSSRSSTR